MLRFTRGAVTYAERQTKPLDSPLTLCATARHLCRVLTGEVIVPEKSGACVPFTGIWLSAMKHIGYLPGPSTVWGGGGFHGSPAAPLSL